MFIGDRLDEVFAYYIPEFSGCFVVVVFLFFLIIQQGHSVLILMGVFSVSTVYVQIKPDYDTVLRFSKP